METALRSLKGQLDGQNKTIKGLTVAILEFGKQIKHQNATIVTLKTEAKTLKKKVFELEKFKLGVKNELRSHENIEHNWCPLTKTIYSGNWGACTSKKGWEKLKKNQISNIIYCGANDIPADSMAKYKEMKIKHDKFNLPSDKKSSGIMKGIFKQIYKIIGSASKVLVHCNSGESKSIAAICYYLMRKKKMSMKTVMKNIIHLNPNASLETGFEDVLESMSF
jgi:hypothetical protein